MNSVHARKSAPRGLRCGVGSLAWTAVAAVVALSSVALAGPVSTSYIYGIDDNSQLWVMGLSGTSGGTAQLLGTTTLTGSSANGLAYDRGREQLFAADTTTDELYWWQQGAATYTSLGSIAPYITAGRPQSAAFYADAYWFLGGATPGNMLNKLSLDYTNGVPTIVSGTSYEIVGMPTSASGGGDMVITPAGMLYAYSAPGLGNFFSVDVTTIASGTVGGYTLISTTPGTGMQLALGVDDTTLYGSTGGSWYIVDKTDGSTTQVSGLSTASFRDLGGSSIQAVPEPGTMVLAATGLGIAAWQVTRRRKSRRPDDADVDADSPIVLLT